MDAVARWFGFRFVCRVEPMNICETQQRLAVMKHLNKFKYVTHSVFSVIYDDGSSDLTLAQLMTLANNRNKYVRLSLFFCRQRSRRH